MTNNRRLFRVMVSCLPYNPRILKNPWIGKIIQWPVGASPVMQWGRFIGNPKEGGILEIMAATEDIIWTGQKTVSGGPIEKKWFIVMGPDDLRDTHPSHAREIWNKWHPPVAIDPLNQDSRQPSSAEKIKKYLATISDKDLIEEVKRRGWSISNTTNYQRYLSF